MQVRMGRKERRQLGRPKPKCGKTRGKGKKPECTRISPARNLEHDGEPAGCVGKRMPARRSVCEERNELGIEARGRGRQSRARRGHERRRSDVASKAKSSAPR